MKKNKSRRKDIDSSTREKPTTPSGDALDDTGEDNQRGKQSKQSGGDKSRMQREKK